LFSNGVKIDAVDNDDDVVGPMNVTQVPCRHTDKHTLTHTWKHTDII